MLNYLVLCALGSDQPGVINKLSELAVACGCNIVQSRMSCLGNEFGITMMLSGEWNAIAKMEHCLPPLAQKLNLNTIIKRTTLAEYQERYLPYKSTIIAEDSAGIILLLADFFADKGINIFELDLESFKAQHSGTEMIKIKLRINIPTALKLAELKNNFRELCDQHNLDANLEPLDL